MLKGANGKELKKIKIVVRYAVLVAYQLILETAFLVDQRTMFSTLPLGGVMNIPVTDCNDANVSCNESIAEPDSSGITDTQYSNGFHEEASNGLEGDTLSGYESYKPVDFSEFVSLSASQTRAFRSSFPVLYSSDQSVSTYLDDVPNCRTQCSNEVSTALELNGHSDKENTGKPDAEKAVDNDRLSAYREACLHTENPGETYEEKPQFQNAISTLFDAYSILVLMSRRNSSEGTICEKNHFSHIRFYRNFDVPLGMFLQESLLNQVCTIPHFFSPFDTSLCISREGRSTCLDKFGYE